MIVVGVDCDDQFISRCHIKFCDSDRFDAPCFDDAVWVSFRITEIMPFNNTVKQEVPELTDARLRLEALHRFLGEQQLIA